MRKKVKQYIDEADDDTVKIVYSMLQADKEEWWDHLPKEVQKSILKAEKELEEGKGIPHEEVMKRYEKWFKKSPPTPSTNKPYK